MAESVTVRVDGMKELEEVLLNETPKKVRAAVRPALRECGEWMKDLISEAAPMNDEEWAHERGFLRANIISRVTISAKNDEATVSVGPNQNAFYGAFVELGHRLVRGGYSRTTLFGSRGPGREIGIVPPHPFVRTTFEMHEQAWLDMLTEKLRENVGL
jgi:HK97 gp10 family phage protein